MHCVHATAAVRGIQPAGHVACCKHLGVAGALLKAVDACKALCIKRQATARQPARCLRANGQKRHVAGQSCTAAKYHLAWIDTHAVVLQHRDVQPFERSADPALNCGRVALSGRCAAGDQRDPAAWRVVRLAQ